MYLVLLLKQRAEVVKMSIFEYDEEREIELIRRDEQEIGEKIGKEIGKGIGEKIGIEKERQRAQQELEKTGRIPFVPLFPYVRK